MPEYTVTFARSARKELEKLPSKVAEKVLDVIESLTADPRPVGCKRLHGFKNLWRIRCGEYRIIYGIEDSARIVDISIVRHRKDVYRLL